MVDKHAIKRCVMARARGLALTFTLARIRLQTGDRVRRLGAEGLPNWESGRIIVSYADFGFH